MTSELKMPVLAPLKLRTKHREGYHSKSQMNILISEPSTKTRNVFRHPNICNVNYTKEADNEAKLNKIKCMVNELLSTCSNAIKEKLIIFVKELFRVVKNVFECQIQIRVMISMRISSVI